MPTTPPPSPPARQSRGTQRKCPIICWTVKSAQQQQDLRQYYDNMIFDSYLPDRDDLRKMAGEPCLYNSDKEN